MRSQLSLLFFVCVLLSLFLSTVVSSLHNVTTGLRLSALPPPFVSQVRHQAPDSRRLANLYISASNSAPERDLHRAKADRLPLGQGPTDTTDLQVGTVLDTPCLSPSTALSNDSDSLLLLMTRKTRATIAVLSSLIAYVSINSLVRAVNPSAFLWYDEDHEEPHWIASSHSWLDRKACRFFGLCGLSHFRLVTPTFGHRVNRTQKTRVEEAPWHSFWTSGVNNWDEWDDAERARREIPDYVMEYAPFVYLSSGEQFWPSDIAEHLYHTTPMLNYTPVQSKFDHPTLDDLDTLNQWEGGRNVFLASNDNVEERPPWLEGERNIPEPGSSVEEPWPDWDGRVDGELPGDSEEQAVWAEPDLEHLRKRDEAEPNPFREAEQLFQQELRKRQSEQKPLVPSRNGGRSNAPAVLLVLDKGNGIVDAFWFYFYSFNLGNVVLNVRFGNHVGDWEHCLVRFYHGKPKALFFSAHSAGEAYSYEAVEKIGKRPVIYSAVGTHAMYATPGIHSYVLPLGLLHDRTDRGTLWDPALNSHTYTYDHTNDILRASTLNPDSPTHWFYFNGHWGDKFYPLGDSRQYRFAGQYHYVNGPIGPRFKSLGRRKMCQGSDNGNCVIRDWIGESRRPKRWVAFDEGEYVRA